MGVATVVVEILIASVAGSAVVLGRFVRLTASGNLRLCIRSFFNFETCVSESGVCLASSSMLSYRP
jgi:hypothetical protein